jgi:hypothetical protein
MSSIFVRSSCQPFKWALVDADLLRRRTGSSGTRGLGTSIPWPILGFAKIPLMLQ